MKINKKESKIKLMAKKFLIIDSNSLIHRAYHALPRLTTKKGEVINAVYGFCLVFLRVLKELKPNFIAAAFDAAGPTFRHKEFKKYKAKRPPTPVELSQQFNKVKEILKAFNVPIFEKQGFEADDLIATLSTLIKKTQIYPKIEIIIISGDLDNLQLIDKQTKVYFLRKGVKDIVLYGEENVKEKYQGLIPSQLTDFKSLRGDPSDNIPGVTGIGEKTAIKLIQEFSSLENLYQYVDEICSCQPQRTSICANPRLLAKLKEYKDQAFISKFLVQMRHNAPLDFNLKECEFEKLDKDKITQTLKDFEFFTLIKRLKELYPKL